MGEGGAAWRPDPRVLFDARWHDGEKWTDLVSLGWRVARSSPDAALADAKADAAHLAAVVEAAKGPDVPTGEHAERFVANASVREAQPRMAQQMAWWDQQTRVQDTPKRGAARGRNRGLTVFRSRFADRQWRGWAVLAMVLIGSMAFPSLGAGSASGGRLIPGDRVIVMFASETGLGPSSDAERRIRSSVADAIAWLEQQTGTEVNMEVPESLPVVAVDGSTRPPREVAADIDVAIQVGNRIQSRQVPLVFTTVRATVDEGSRQICGLGSPNSMHIFMDDCRGPGGLTPDQLAIAVAHELIHAMGAVEECAPGYSDGDSGHVDDDPTDIMYSTEGSPRLYQPLATLRLDADRQDYFRHDQSRCADVADSALWR